jgi:hypothetical protein
LSLKAFDRLNWMTSNEHLERIAERIDQVPRVSLLTDEMAVQLSPVDDRSYRAGLLGADDAGLFKPQTRSSLQSKGFLRVKKSGFRDGSHFGQKGDSDV